MRELWTKKPTYEEVLQQLEKDYKIKMLHLEYTLKQVKEVLNEMDDLFHSKLEDDQKKLDSFYEAGLDGVLSKAKVTKSEYYEALKVSKKGKVIVLKRGIKELWVNNYNPEWIRAWNGNMDLQLCLDFFAIVTYITGLVAGSNSLNKL